MGAMAPWTQRALDVLADGSWHSEDSVMLEMVKLVPPGYAMRRAEQRRRNQRPERTGLGTQRAVPRSAEYLRLLGARAIAYEVLRTSKRMEQKTDVNGRWVRMKP